MSEPDAEFAELTCPMPQSMDADCITLAYGEGGRLSRRLIHERILPRFHNAALANLGDAAFLNASGPVALTTDSYTVTPLFFPGGDIGRLAVFGAVNDLAVSGAVPRWLSLALVIEEGLPWAVLDRVLDSIQQAVHSAEVEVVTGDTKVVPRGAVDALFITTSALGELGPLPPPGPSALQAGDVLIVSGPIGRHGAAVLCAREGLDFDPAPTSDCASLVPPLQELQRARLTPRAVRDATRGGVAAVLHEWSAAAGVGITIDETAVPVTVEVRAVCELLGLDPLFLACEGTFVAAVPPEKLNATLDVLARHAVSRSATVIGRVVGRQSAPVCVQRAAGRLIPLDEPAGAPLPRIC